MANRDDLRKLLENDLALKVKLLDLTSEGIIVHDLDGNYLYVNDAGCAMRGYTREELLKLNVRDLAAPGNEEMVKNRLAELKNTGKTEFEIPQMRKDGSIVYLEIHSSIVDLGQTKVVMGVARDITERKKMENELRESEEAAKQQYLKVQRTLEGAINALAMTTENRDPYTAGHQRRVADLAFHIGREMGLSEEQVQGLKLAGLIHDIGKISIPLEILNKPGKLSEAEFTLIQGHSRVGYDILKDIEFGWPIAQIVLQHHERMNGSGYPGKISAGDILLESKILSIADVVEAMASDRPYRAALGVDAALIEITQKKGQLYDSQIVDICNKLFREKGYKFE